MKRFDVAIVGAGPAGSSAAIALARRGYSVALLDKQIFPREKLCGDFVNPINLPLLRALGVEPQVLSGRPERVAGFRITSFLGGEAEIPFRARNGRSFLGLGLSRAFLDNVLLEKAVAEGAAVFTGFRITELARTLNGWELTVENRAVLEELSARILIGADGRSSWVAQKLQLGGAGTAQGRAVGFQMRLQHAPGLDRNVEIHLFPGGYAGLVGIGDGTVNLCLAIENRRLRGARPQEYLLRSGLPQNERLKALLGRSSITGEIRSVYPVYFPPRRCYTDGALLVGDAARVSEPVTGEGIYSALKSGLIAAETIDASFRAGDLSARQLSSYARDCSRAFRIRRGINSLVRWLIYRPHLLSPLIRRSSHKRQLLTPFVQAICTPPLEERQWATGNSQ